MKKTIKVIVVLLMLLMTTGLSDLTLQAIDNTRTDLGILDSLKITDQYGTVIDSNGAILRPGRMYSLRYEWSLDEPTSDYRNKVATFSLPSAFNAATVSPTTIPLYYNDSGINVEIGTININSTNGTVTVQFNNSSILGDKSNIHGYVSLAVECGNTLGETDITVGWNGNNEDKISAEVIEHGIGDNHPAQLNKYVTSGKVGSQPIVQQDGTGKFFVSFSVEVLTSNGHSDLQLNDMVYSGMTIDSSSIKVISRPKDGSIYYLATPNVYKDNFDLWKTQHPTGLLAVDNDITTSLHNSNSIVSSNTGFEINFGNTDFNSTLASRQLTTTPLQIRYRVDYTVFLTGIDPSVTLEQAQSIFESQNAKNSVSLAENKTIITETEWNKGVLGGGAEGEVRAVTLRKVDKVTSAPLSGAVFNLYKQNAYNINLWELYNSNINMTNSSMVVDNLTFGNYRFEEITAPDGYELPSSPFGEFTIDINTPLTNFEVILENSKALGGLQFEKVDAKDNSIKLSATFAIHKKSDDTLVKTVTTGTNGKYETADLEIGEYYLVETIAPEGYVLDTTHYDFTIVVNTTNTVYVGNSAITNEKKTIELPKTGDENNTLMLGILLSGVNIMLMFFVRKKSRKIKY